MMQNQVCMDLLICDHYCVLYNKKSLWYTLYFKLTKKVFLQEYFLFLPTKKFFFVFRKINNISFLKTRLRLEKYFIKMLMFSFFFYSPQFWNRLLDKNEVKVYLLRNSVH